MTIAKTKRPRRRKMVSENGFPIGFRVESPAGFGEITNIRKVLNEKGEDLDVVLIKLDASGATTPVNFNKCRVL